MASSKMIEDLSDFDFEILIALPPQGAKLGFHNVGVSVSGLGLKFAERNVKSSAIAGKLRTFQALGLADTVELHGKENGWQVTPMGSSYAAAWREQNSNSDRKEGST
jgi:hypothetical protein